MAELQRKYGNLASENDALKRQVQGLKGDLAAVGDRNKRLHAEREQALSEVQHVSSHRRPYAMNKCSHIAHVGQAPLRHAEEALQRERG